MSHPIHYTRDMDMKIIQFYTDADGHRVINELTEYLGMSLPTFIKLRKRHPELEEAYQQGMAIQKKRFGNSRIKYRSNYPEIVEKLAMQGLSVAAICAEFDISYVTYYEWLERHPEFKEAIEKGELKAQAHWEELGYDGMLGKLKFFNAKVWALTMKNRFSYTEKTTLAGDPNNPFTQKLTVEFIDTLDKKD